MSSSRFACVFPAAEQPDWDWDEAKWLCILYVVTIRHNIAKSVQFQALQVTLALKKEALEFTFASFLSNFRQTLTLPLAWISRLLLNKTSAIDQQY